MQFKILAKNKIVDEDGLLNIEAYLVKKIWTD